MIGKSTQEMFFGIYHKTIRTRAIYYVIVAQKFMYNVSLFDSSCYDKNL